jgi:hypothetical protein
LRSAKESLSRLRNLQVYAFPKPEYDVFKQLVVVGQKTSGMAAESAEIVTGLAGLARLSPEAAWESLPKTPEMPKGSMVLPPAAEGRLLFTSERADMEKAAELVARSPLWKELEVLTAAKALHNIRPLAQLRQGHLAMLLAGGLMNGVVESNGKRLVIKGSVKKKVDKETEVTDTHYIEKRIESHQVFIRAIDLDKKEIFSIS